MVKEQDQFVKCTLGTPEERRQGLFALQTASVVVVGLAIIAVFFVRSSRKAAYPSQALDKMQGPIDAKDTETHPLVFAE